MPFLTFLLSNHWRTACIALALVMAIGGAILKAQVGHYRAKAERIEAEYEGFKLKVAALGEAAEANKKRKEADNAKRIAVAVADRNDDLRRLSDERSRRGSVPFAPPDTGGSGKICYDRAALESALQRFAERTAGLIDEGDAALINGRALVEAWPRP